MDTLLGQITPQWKLIDGPLQDSAIAQMLATKMRRDKILGEYKYHRVDLGDPFTVESYAAGAAVGGSESEAYLDLPIVYAKLAIPFDINEDILDELEAAGSQDGARTLAYRKMQWVKRANLELVRQIMGTCDTPGALCEVTSVTAGVVVLKNCPDILANSFLHKKVQFDLVNKTVGTILTKDGGGSATGYVAYCIKKTDGAHVIGLASSVALAAAGTVDATLTITDCSLAVLCYPDMYTSTDSLYVAKTTDCLLRLLKYHSASTDYLYSTYSGYNNPRLQPGYFSGSGDLTAAKLNAAFMNSAAYPKVPKNFALAMDSNVWANFVGTLLGSSYVKAMPGESANPVQGVQLHDTVVRYEANPFWQWTGKVAGMDMDQLRLYTPNSAVVQTEAGGAISWRERFGKLQGKTGYYSAVDSLKLAVQVAHTGIRNTSFYMPGFDSTIDTN